MAENLTVKAHRLRIILIVIPLILAFSIYAILIAEPEILQYVFGLPFELVVVLIFLLIGLSTLGATLMYLQTGFKRDREPFPNLNGETVTGFSNRLSKLEVRLKDLTLRDQEISQSEKIDLVQRVRKSIETAANSEFLEDIRTSVKERLSDEEFLFQTQLSFDRTIRRLNDELISLTRRGNLNLTLEIITALAGFFILAYFVYELSNLLEPITPDLLDPTMQWIVNFLPRISLVILVEIFSYFFLRLYSNSLVEIKYFQNELTNVESKYYSLLAAVHTGNENTITDVISRLSQTERNYVLRKGQTTVNLESSKMENETITLLVKNLIKAISRKK